MTTFGEASAKTFSSPYSFQKVKPPSLNKRSFNFRELVVFIKSLGTIKISSPLSYSKSMLWSIKNRYKLLRLSNSFDNLLFVLSIIS